MKKLFVVSPIIFFFISLMLYAQYLEYNMNSSQMAFVVFIMIPLMYACNCIGFLALLSNTRKDKED